MQRLDRPSKLNAERNEPAWDVALLFPTQGNWSVEEYLGLDTNHLVEFSHGHIEVLPMPSDRHQAIVGYLFVLFLQLAKDLGGTVRTAPLRLQLWSDKFREPDLIFLASAADPRRQDRFWIGADLVIEVVSPDAPRRDIVTKRAEYARAGIPEYWIVDPRDEIITVLRLTGDGYDEHGRFSRDESATSSSYPDMSADVAAVFDAP